MKLIVGLTLLSGLLFAQAEKPEPRVQGNAVTSERLPKRKITLPKTVKYAGADRWILYGHSDCELHAFVEADANQQVRNLYWIQFEGYLPSYPEMHHTYDSPRHAVIGGLDFYVDTWVRPDGAPTESGSDREHIEALVKKAGYRMPPGMMYVRLVHLLDAEKRRELMIIYGEDLAPTGFTAAELDEGGTARNRWPEFEKGLIERAKQKISLH
jgi:hypothetical protein